MNGQTPNFQRRKKARQYKLQKEFTNRKQLSGNQRLSPGVTEGKEAKLTGVIQEGKNDKTSSKADMVY